jgi:hypothetical protein
MSLSTYKLASGAEIEVESHNPPPPRQGADQASALDRMTAAAWDEAMARVAELADQAVSRLAAVTKGCKEAAVEFGVSIGGKTGIVLVEGTVNANLKVTLKW